MTVKLHFLLWLYFLASFSQAYSMIGQPFNYTPARTPYWYRSQAKSREQAQIKKYWEKIREQEQQINAATQMQSEYDSARAIPETEYLPD